MLWEIFFGVTKTCLVNIAQIGRRNPQIFWVLLILENLPHWVSHFQAFTKTLALSHVPKETHIASIPDDPVLTAQSKALQCGAGVTNGVVRIEVKVVGAQKCV